MPSFGLNSWTTGEAVDAVTDIRAAGAAGFRFVELCDWKIERHLAAGGSVAALRDQAEEAGLGVLSVNTLDDATLHEGVALESRVQRCGQLCEWARALDCPNVIVGPSYLADGADRGPPITDRTAASLTRLAAVAADHGVRIAFEYHGYANCSINDLAGARAALDAAGDERIGLVIDAFHFYVGNSSFDDLARLDGSRILIAHLADVDHGDRATLRKPNRVLPGDGVLPLKRLVEGLRRAGYAGPYSLEMFREEYWAMDPFLVARLARDSLGRVTS